MNYQNIPQWRKAEKKGNLYEAIALLLKELKINCDRVPNDDQPNHELVHFIYLSIAHTAAVTDVPFSTQKKLLDELKVARQEIKQIIKSI